MDLPINANKSLPVYLEMLRAIKQQIDAIQTHSPRVFLFRLDVHLDRYTEDNKPISRFIHKLTKWITKTYGGPIGYLWAREHNKARAQHYHLIIMVNGKKVRYPSRIIDKADQIAEGWEWPRTGKCENCYYDIRPGDIDAYRAAFRRASYLAKVRTKGGKGKTANNYGRSNIKPKSA